MFSTPRFPQKLNDFINSLPHVHHVIPYCTHGIPQRPAHFLASENKLVELLTVYTKTNRSAALFLGTKSESKPESGKGNRRQQVSDRSFLGDVGHQEPVVPRSETWRDILKQSSDDQGSLLLSDR